MLAHGYREAKRLGLDPIHVVDLSLVLFIFGIAGSRLFFILLDYKRFVADPREIYRIWNGGLVWYGGLIAAVFAGVIFIKKRGLDLGVWTDLAAPTAMIALVFGRMGCLLNGCCYGKVAADLPWGIVYPVSHPAPIGLAQVKVHPAPLYESLAALVITVILVMVSRYKKFHGQVFWMMIILYAIARFILEYYRGDYRGTVTLAGLSTSQAVSVVAGLAAVVMLVHLYRRARVEASV
jgi:phosphatidylglycerol:prolipoprotein diacylglycerol transferase